MKYLVFMLFLIAAKSVNGQSDHVFSVHPASHSFSTPNMNVNWVIGELFGGDSVGENVVVAPGINDIGSILIVTDLAQILEGSLQVSPIPFSDFLNIRLTPTNGNTLIGLTLSSMDGSNVMIKVRKNSEGFDLDATEIAAGSYLLKVQLSRSRIKTFKVIKQ